MIDYPFKALSLRPRVIFLIHDPESFFLFRARAHDPESFFLFMTHSHFFPFRALSSRPKVVLLIYDPKLFLAFRALSSQPKAIFTLQVFRATTFFHGCLESQAFKSPIGIQSHNFPSQAFRAIFSSFRCSKPFLSSVLGIQRHSSLPVSSAQSHYLSIVWRSESSSYVFSLAFRAMSLVLGVQSHVFNLEFKVIIFFNLAFKAIVHTHSGIQSHHLSSFGHSESFFLSHIIQSHSSQHSYSLALHILPSQFYIRPHFPHFITLCLSLVHHALLCFDFIIGTPHLMSLYSVCGFSICTHSYALWWFNYYSALISIFRVTFGDFSGVLDPQCNFGGTLGVFVHAISFLQGFRASLFLFWFKRAHVILGQIWWSFFFFGRAHFVSFVYILTLLVDFTEK